MDVFSIETVVGVLATYGSLSIISKAVKGVRKIGDKVGKIILEGPIYSYKTTSSPLGSKQMITPAYVKEAVDYLLTNYQIKGIIFEIDSPGGMVVPSQEIGEMIKNIELPTVALVKSCAASGGYWLASCCDKIVVSPLSIVGSIGVIAEHFNVSKLADSIGVKYDGFKAGIYKDMGSLFRDFTEQEKQIMQEEIDYMHEVFIKVIAENREIEYHKVKELAEGLVYLGEKAVEFKLADVLGGENEALDIIKKAANLEDAEIKEYEKKSSLISKLFGGAGASFGMSVSQSFLNSFVKFGSENRINIH
jgi:protease-4